ncbi:hypothetical protein HYR99_19955 [Candidatus Poribacteria bacterium]|nr:hypothetical protein [Candidatus Poribacteria bacterium]
MITKTKKAAGELRNKLIRKWYFKKVNKIPELNQKWLKQGRSARERARKAWEIRHKARLKARRMMKREEAEKLRSRDKERYGNPDGPTFEQIVKKYEDFGFEGNEVYEQIIQSSSRTNREVNQRFGMGQ